MTQYRITQTRTPDNIAIFTLERVHNGKVSPMLSSGTIDAPARMLAKLTGRDTIMTRIS